MMLPYYLRWAPPITISFLPSSETPKARVPLAFCLCHLGEPKEVL
ncbi:hypothetical protein E2C01_014573 [Portunus trituberculatus]|uniref:Uncharacterized protein n=1 Tax=Portunus trituberculatus TaxID=210409 RepID=A0A5B7DKB2_PORTR|nr:hypothetical protein [Portunus trituberculatus]